jgi:hypothetical protein
MKRIIAILSFALLLITPALAGEPELMGAAESREILSYYGFQNGNFSIKNKKSAEINFLDENNVGSIEKGGSIDTKEEFITAAYFTPVDIKPSAKARIEQHLPKTRAGVLKLCNMWKLKMAELPGHRAKYAAAIRLVRKLASEKMGIDVSSDAVDRYWVRAVDNKLDSLRPLIRELNEEEKQQAVKLTRAYLLNPSESNQKALSDYKYSFDNHSGKARDIRNLLVSFSENLLMVI